MAPASRTSQLVWNIKSRNKQCQESTQMLLWRGPWYKPLHYSGTTLQAIQRFIRHGVKAGYSRVAGPGFIQGRYQQLPHTVETEPPGITRLEGRASRKTYVLHAYGCKGVKRSLTLLGLNGGKKGVQPPPKPVLSTSAVRGKQQQHTIGQTQKNGLWQIDRYF